MSLNSLPESMSKSSASMSMNFMLQLVASSSLNFLLEFVASSSMNFFSILVGVEAVFEETNGVLNFSRRFEGAKVVDIRQNCVPKSSSEPAGAEAAEEETNCGLNLFSKICGLVVHVLFVGFSVHRVSGNRSHRWGS